MFGSRSAAARIDALHAERIADLKEAHAAERAALMKVIDALAEQIEYLRATFGRPLLTGAKPTPGLAWQGTDLDVELPGEDRRMHMSEEEEDLLALRESGLLTDNELEASLARLQIQ
jgi:hypothetical protein